ncbi:MAG TPA: adenylate/guanylate cyclase domain-containing protein [Chitinophagaceae bacterium]|nr:adenylate/guanylate cyclase domain-containing protein [Chitinophagaceae bacterium]
MPRKLLIYRLRILLVISIIWIVFGVLFFENLLRTATDIGIEVRLIPFLIAYGITGFFISSVLIFYLKSAFNHQPLWLTVTLKMLSAGVVFAFIFCVLLILYFFFHPYRGNMQQYIDSVLTKLIFTKTFALLVVDTGLMSLLSIAILEVNDKYGPGLFWSMLKGQYLQPKREDRIFIFLDINESTTIAEQLGHEKYFYMLRRFFSDITHPVLVNDGTIYQYVGDEIVLTWPNTPENKAKSLKFIRNAFYVMERKSSVYNKKYGRVPRFKAGIHAGEVTAGFVGIIKKELIFCGDTVNTTSRICGMCHELNEPFIVSEDFMEGFEKPFGYYLENIGEKEMKGKRATTKLYSLKFD